MKITRLGPTRPLISLTGLLSGGDAGPAGQVPTSIGSNGAIAWGSNVALITVNGSTKVLGPYVNFANGSNTTVTVDQVGSVASNTIRIHSTGGGGSLTVQDEGTPLATDATTLNFVGAGVTASGAGATKTITIPGGGGSGVTGLLPVNVASNTQTSSASTLSVTITAASSGNLLIATISSIGTVNVSSISSTNTTWTVLQSSTAGTSPKAEIWKGVVAGGSSGTTVTITLSGNSSDRSAVISEWSGITGTLDQSSSRSGVAVSANGYINSTPVILPTNANALVVACIACTNGTVRFGQAGGGLVAFEPLVLGTGSLGGYQGAYFGFPGTVPVAAQAVGPTSGNYSGTIVSVT